MDDPTKTSAATENAPLLPQEDRGTDWTPPKGFWFIEVALWSNAFLSGFDGTITASTYTLISSDFNSANSASWLTTSYLITSTAFQPLYGRFSDVFGRRACFFFSTVLFIIGCFGCAIAPNIWCLDAMRCVTGMGGGGLITMATIINSDIIPFERRGMYQAAQNCLIGFGAVCGASLGGAIADSFGWRWCFLAQVPFSILALVVGYLVLEDPLGDMFYLGEKASLRFALTHVDVLGSAVLVVALLVQLLALSLGGNQLPWGSPWVLGALAASIILLGIFGVVEATTKTIPIIPLRMLRGRLPVFTQITNVFSGMAAYAFIFMLPLFFQVVVMDTPSKAGMRLMIPSLSTPMGGLIAGYTMSKCGRLARLIRIGTLLMTVGNLLLVLLDFENASWKYLLFLFPANLGLGMMNPSVLFSFISAFEHREQAVATSLVYLIRSLGNIWGVTITSSIVQNVLSTRLPEALKDIRHSDRVIDEIRHSVFALRGLPPTVQLAARHVYFEAIRIAFIASTCFAAISFLASLFADAKSLERAPVQWVGEEEAA